MKPQLNKIRDRLFTAVCLLAVVANAAAGVAIAMQPETQLQSTQAPAGLTDPAAFAKWAPVACGALTLLAYLLSLDPHRRKRPFWRLFLLFASAGALAAGYPLRYEDVRGVPMLVAAIVAGIIVIGLLPLLLERLGAMMARAIGSSLYRNRAIRASLYFTGLALSWRPSWPPAELLYGLELADSKRPERGKPYLEEAYEKGTHTPPVLAALASICQSADENERTVELLSELYQQEPSPQLLRRLALMLEKSGQSQRMLNLLNGLPAEQREEWLDKICEAAWQLRDSNTLRSLCREFSAEGSSLPRAQDAYEKLLQLLPDDSEALSAVAEAHRLAGRYDRTAATYERLLNLDPGREVERRWLIRHYRTSREPAVRDWIRGHLQALIENGSATLNEKLDVMTDLLAHQDYERLEAMANAHSDLVHNAEARLLLATSMSETGRTDDALAVIAEARKLEADDEITQKMTSLEKRLNDHKLEHRIEDLENLIRQYPDNLDLHFEYMDWLVKAGTLEKVIVDLDEILGRNPEMHDRVVEHVEKMLEQHGANFRLLSYLSDIYLRDNNWDKVHELHQAMSKVSMHPDVVLHEGATTILRSNPAHAPSLLTLAQHAHRMGHYENALNYLSRYYLAGGERTLELAKAEFESAVQCGNIALAGTVADFLLGDNPDDVRVMLDLADALARAEQYTEAISYIKRASALQPENTELGFTILDLDHKRKRARIEELRRLVEQEPRNLDAREELGDLYHDFTMLNEAIVEYQKAALGDKSRNIARAKLGYVLARKDMFGEAEEALGEVELKVDQEPEEQQQIKALIMNAADLMEDEKQFARALHLYKRIFRIDAGYDDIVARIERLQRIGIKG